MRRVALIALTGAALAAAGCGGDGDSSGEAGDQGKAAEKVTLEKQAGAPKKKAPTKGAAPATGLTIKATGSDFGTILFDDSDRAIYLFTKESSVRSECYGACAAAWPPVLTDGKPQAGTGTDAGLFGTTKRTDGSTQVTYNGHPLYYYVDDPPGQVLCHDVEEFGGIWYVVKPSGDAAA
jgi:predicted lipoprotein with Yx(FWY)xxD motif